MLVQNGEICLNVVSDGKSMEVYAADLDRNGFGTVRSPDGVRAACRGTLCLALANDTMTLLLRPDLKKDSEEDR